MASSLYYFDYLIGAYFVVFIFQDEITYGKLYAGNLNNFLVPSTYFNIRESQF